MSILDSTFSKKVLKASNVFSNILTNFSIEFEKDHDQYCIWLKKNINLTFNRDLAKIFTKVGIDWTTIHYRTRHPAKDWSSYREWLQIGIPLSNKIIKYKNILQVYSKGESPYISYFSNKKIMGDAIKILLFNDAISSRQKGWLCVEELLIEYIKKITIGTEPQPDLSKEETFRCIQKNKTSVDEIRFTFSKLIEKELSASESLGIFRNVCRVTFLALKEADLKNDSCFRLPRTIILAPAFVEENIIGGIAFLGNRIIMENIFPLLLANFTNSILSGIRLREEPLREFSIYQLEELSKARAEFIQRVSHSIFSPLDALWLRLSDAVDSLAGLKARVNELRSAASDLILVFGKDNVDDFLRIKPTDVKIKEFIDTIMFLFKKQFEQKNIQLQASKIPDDWTIQIDKTSILEVITNLLTNALRYAKKRVKIIVRKRFKSKTYVILVRDDGPGINPDILPILFKPGIKDKFPEKKDKESHGFGLFLSKRVIENHNGKIYLNKEYKFGAEFVLELHEQLPSK